jgi:transcription initiation factor TFIIH subunit 1
MGKDLEPRQAPKRSVDMFLDLAATEEDHDEVNNVVSALFPSWRQVDKPSIQTGNINDYTMQAGKQRNTLPLIRRFNEHSNRLVMRE